MPSGHRPGGTMQISKSIIFSTTDVFEYVEDFPSEAPGVPFHIVHVHGCFTKITFHQIRKFIRGALARNSFVVNESESSISILARDASVSRVDHT